MMAPFQAGSLPLAELAQQMAGGEVVSARRCPIGGGQMMSYLLGKGGGPIIEFPVAGGGRFVGRSRELGVLQGLVSGVADGTGGVLLVSGEQGVGKSALLAEGLAGASDAGCKVQFGTADELDQRFPLRLMAEVLGKEGRAATTRGSAARSPLLAVGGDPMLARVESMLALVNQWCAAGPVVVEVEDLQWADEASLLVWERLAAAAGQLPLLVAGSCRPGGQRIERLVRRVRERSGAVVDLGPLDEVDVARLAAGLLEGRPGRRLAGLLRRAGGNPLYVRELAAALVRDGRVVAAGQVAELTGDVRAVRVPVSLQAAIAGRLAELPAEVAGVLRWAAVLGTEFSVADLGVVTELAAGELAGPLQQAAAAGLVAETGSRLRFRHGLIRQVLYEAMPGAVTAALHGQAAQALATAGARADRVATQLAAAPEEAGEWMADWMAGTVEELTRQAPQMAAGLLRRVLAKLGPDDSRRQSLEAALVAVAHLLMAYEDMERAAWPLLARTTDPERAAQVAWHLAYARQHIGQMAEAVADVEEALARPGISPVWTARLRALLALLLSATGGPDRAADAARQALADARWAGDRFAAGYALHAMALADARRGDHAAALGHAGQALAMIGDDPETTDLRLLLLAGQADLLADLDRHAEADATIQLALSLAERGMVPQLGIVCTVAAERYFDRGLWDEALAVLEPAAVLLGAEPARLVFHGLAALIAGHRNDSSMAEEHIAAVPVEALRLPGHQIASRRLLLARALAAERAGQPAKAVAMLAPFLKPEVAEIMQGRYLLLPPLARAALAARDDKTLAASAEAARAHWDGPPVMGAAARVCRGLAEGDPGLVLDAAAYYQGASRPVDRALALEDAAVLLAGLGQPGEARRAFTAAAQLYQELGAVWDLGRAETRLRQYGIRLRRDRRRARPGQGWAALTPTEEKIAWLVAEGRSNPDIAAVLFLSRNTVQTHVSHILAKLGARSRAEIIRQALDRDTAP
jgi:DNA-binding CsgD family transcriptional regulator